MKKRKSWLTTFFGWLAGVAGIVSMTVPDPRVHFIAGAVAAGATAALGTVARDNKVSSESVGAK